MEGDTSPGSSAETRFALAPLRGLRFDPAQVGDLGTVVSPPYDVLDAETVRELEAANRHNVVRLILSRRFERPYQVVRERLQDWRRRGVLRTEPRPSLYVYEYVVDGASVRGLVGLVGLRPESSRLVLPHEEVMPEPVEDRVALMRATGSNLEPILLVHNGGEALRALTDAAMAAAPAADFIALGGSRHRLWVIDDPSVLGKLAGELEGTRALIADGHHRYAAYRRLQRELRSGEPGTSPWDYGLAMLVDDHDSQLRVGPIHRTVAGLTLADIEDSSAARGDGFRRIEEQQSDRVLEAPPAEDTARFVVSDGRAWAVVSTSRTHRVDAAVLHDNVLPAWGVAEQQVGYHHSVDQALHSLARSPGVLVEVRPPALTEVMEWAAAGVRMPRKSTSFGPKPQMGVVMRDLADDR